MVYFVLKRIMNQLADDGPFADGPFLDCIGTWLAKVYNNGQ